MNSADDNFAPAHPPMWPLPAGHASLATPGDSDKRPRDPEGPPDYIDMPTRLRGSWRVFVWYLFYFALATAFFVFLAIVFRPVTLTSGFGSFIFIMLVAIFISFLLGILPWWQKRRARKIAERIFEDDPNAPLPVAIKRMRAKAPYLSQCAGEVQMAILLAQVTHEVNYIVRMAPEKSFWRVNATDVDFEPRPLNESDATFNELAEATAAEADHDAGFRFTRPDDLPLRALRRNIWLKGGYLSLIITFLFWFRSAYDFYQTGSPDFFFFLWSFFFASKLFAPATGGLRSANWYLIPRGILIDQRNLDPETPYFMADRLDASLVLHQQSKRMWNVHVAATHGSGSITATNREVEMLLRCWTSKVNPPDGEVVGALFASDAKF